MTLKIRTCALALLAAFPAVAGAQTAQPAPPAAAATPPAVPAPSPLSTIPGVTITYYDVAGTTIEQLRASIEAQRRNPTTGVVSPSSLNWNIGTNFQRERTGNQCRVINARAVLTAEVILPRLVTAEVPAPVLEGWRTYVASMEQQQAEILRRPLSRLSEVEQAVMAATCDGAAAASRAAIDRITAPPPPPPVPAATTPATPPAPAR